MSQIGTQQSRIHPPIAQIAEVFSDSQIDLTNNPSYAADRSQVLLNSSHSHQASKTTLAEAWTEGLTTNDLVARLQTNPSTLKKYLRDLNQVRWAVQRDPNGLGWVYDPLLERYYPVEASAADEAFTKVSASSDSDVPEQIQSSTSDISHTPKFNLVDYEQLEYKGGLTQSQISRLTNIPINTLQRWKQLPDCSERIRCRTEGAFAYSYFEQHRCFYPLRSRSG